MYLIVYVKVHFEIVYVSKVNIVYMSMFPLGSLKYLQGGVQKLLGQNFGLFWPGLGVQFYLKELIK